MATKNCILPIAAWNIKRVQQMKTPPGGGVYRKISDG